MSKHYTYLLINFCTVIFPLLLSFDGRVQFFKSWKYLWPGMAITGMCFLGWDVLFIREGVWLFNPGYITGINFFQLPLEEILFFLTVPFACVFIYACLKYYVKWQAPEWAHKTLTVLLLISSVLMAVIYHHRLYTLTAFSLLLALLLLTRYVFKAAWLSRFYLTYLVILIPFLIVNGVLTGIPVVIYNPAENMNLRTGTIPVEDFFYLMALLLMNVGFFEHFKSSTKRL